MAKRMQFSVVGLPHYTIWHLYEPSYEDVRRMEEMEKEKRKHEEEEKQRLERQEKINEQFDVDAKQQFEKDKEAMREARNDGPPAGAGAAANQGDKVTKDDVQAGVAKSEAGFQKDGSGKVHLSDPLGEIRHMGGEQQQQQHFDPNLAPAHQPPAPAAPPPAQQPADDVKPAAVGAEEPSANRRAQAEREAHNKAKPEPALQFEALLAAVGEPVARPQEPDEGWKDPRKLHG